MNAKWMLALLTCWCACLGWAAATEEEPELNVVMTNDKGGISFDKITQDDYVNVTGDRRKVPVTVHSYQVKEVTYVDKDGNYDDAVKKRDEGRYTLAALYFKRALDAMGDKKWAVEYCNYGIGNAIFSAGHYKGYPGRTYTYSAPSVYFKKVLEANPKSRFMLDVVVKLAINLAEEDRLQEADAALKDAEDRINKYRNETIKVAGGYKDLADKAIAQLSIAAARIADKRAAKDGQWTTARDAWAEARRKCAKYPDLIAETVEGELRAILMSKDYASAKMEASGIIDRYEKQNDYTVLPLLPAAYTVLGKANLAQAVDFDARHNQLQANALYADSRWAFLHVIAQFFDNDEYVAGAHYFAGLCYDKLRDIEKNDAGDKAVRHWQLIVLNFPKSDFKDLAVKELNRLGVAPAKVETPVPSSAAGQAITKPEAPAKAAPIQPAPRQTVPAPAGEQPVPRPPVPVQPGAAAPSGIAPPKADK